MKHSEKANFSQSKQAEAQSSNSTAGQWVNETVIKLDFSNLQDDHNKFKDITEKPSFTIESKPFHSELSQSKKQIPTTEGRSK